MDNTFHFNSQSFDRLTGFNFNSNSLLTHSLLKFPEVFWEENLLRITIPQYLAKDIRYPAYFQQSELNIRIDFYNLETGELFFHDLDPYTHISYLDGPAEESFEFEFPPRCLALVSVCVLFVSLGSSHATMYNSKSFHLAGIIASKYNDSPMVQDGVKKNPLGLHFPFTEIWGLAMA